MFFSSPYAICIQKSPKTHRSKRQYPRCCSIGEPACTHVGSPPPGRHRSWAAIGGEDVSICKLETLFIDLYIHVFIHLFI